MSKKALKKSTKAPKRKKGSGGSRKGAGRKVTNPNTKMFGFSHKIKIIDEVRSHYGPKEVNNMGRDFLDDLHDQIPPIKQK